MSASKAWMGTTAEGVQDNVIGPITDFAMELFRTVPDAIQFGSLALYLLTQNYTFGIFTLFTFETTLFHKVISFIFKGAGGEADAASKEARCRSGFRSPRFEFERRFMTDTYPSLGLYFFSAMAAYLSLATYLFSDTLQFLGPVWTGRLGFSTAFVTLILLFLTVYRFFTGCDTLITVLVALFIGALTGTVFYFINYNVFGVEAMNFLGLPYVVDKADQSNPIYVCAPTLS
jgi:hypothetical protein